MASTSFNKSTRHHRSSSRHLTLRSVTVVIIVIIISPLSRWPAAAAAAAVHRPSLNNDVPFTMTEEASPDITQRIIDEMSASSISEFHR